MSHVKIHVYDVPEELLCGTRLLAAHSEFLDGLRGWPLSFHPGLEALARSYSDPESAGDWTQQYGFDLVLFQAIGASSWATADPDEADLYLIPNLATTLYVRLLKDLEYLDFEDPGFDELFFPRLRGFADRYVAGLLDFVGSEHPYLDRKQGRDHVFVCTWDNGLGTDEDEDPYTGNLFGNAVRERVRQMVYVGSQADGDAVVIPPFLNSSLCRRVLSDPRSRDFSIGHRRVLAFFRGALHHPDRRLYADCYADDPEMPTNTPEMETAAFEDLALSSLFSVCLEGATPWTMRLAQAFLYGAIPVIVSDHLVLPFEDQVEWTDCSLRFSPEEIPRLKSALSSLSFEEVARLQRGLAENAGRLLFDSERPLCRQDFGTALLGALSRRLGSPPSTSTSTRTATWKRISTR